MSENSSQPLPPPGHDLLIHLAIIIESIITNLQKNRFDRKSIQKLLREYVSRAESDGRLLYTARVNQCVDHALFLAYAHLELVSWLVKNNYNLQATSVKWYSYKKLLPKYQLPLFSILSQTAELRDKLYNIEQKAELTYADLQANNVPIPPTTIEYRKVSASSPKGHPPESFENILHRGSVLRQQLSWPAT